MGILIISPLRLHYDPNQTYFASFVVFVISLWSFEKRETTKDAKTTDAKKRIQDGNLIDAVEWQDPKTGT